MKNALTIRRLSSYSFKFSLAMKLTSLLLLVSVFSIQANSYSQKVKVTLRLDNVEITELFEKIEKETKYKFLFNHEEINLNRIVSVNVESEPLSNVLHDLFAQSSTTYVVRNKQIILKGSDLIVPIPKDDVTTPIKEAIPQSSVTGTVTDENGQPLPGANILEKGTTNGTQTDFDGNYSIALTTDEPILVFSYIGFQKQEKTVGKSENINVQMATDSQGLDEVVVIGYGTVKKSDITGSVASISEEDFNPGVNASVNQLIQGRAAGVQIQQTSSEPGGGVSVRVRGSSSVNAGNEPLYVIDGLPIDNGAVTPSAQGITGPTNTTSPSRNPLNSLNPGDIKSIEVLKDASATAIYGSRGANGVVLITTKGGRKNSREVSFSTYTGIQEVADTYDMLNAQQYTQVLNELNVARGNEPIFSPQEVNSIGAGTNWQREIFRSAKTVNHQLAISGGGENNTYYASVNYFDQEGVIENSGITRYSTRLNLTQDYGKLSVGLNLNASFQKDNFTAYNNGGQNNQAGAIQSAVFYDPTAPVFDADGNYNQASSMDFENPLALVREVLNNAETTRVFGTAYMQYELLPGLQAKLNVGADKQSARRDSYYPTTTLFGSQNGGVADIANREASNYLMEFTLNYDKKINDSNQINLLAGYTYQNFINRGANVSAQGFPTDVFLTDNIGSAANSDTYIINSFKNRNQLLSYLGRANYSLLDKYLLTGSIRVDGSSRFGDNNKYGVFPSGAFAWKLAKEKFIDNLNVFSDMKLRLSYGITGNQSIPSYLSLPLFSVRNNNAVIGGQEVASIGVVNLSNPDLKWERTGQFNVGLDLGFAKGRITSSIDYYIKDTDDLLFNQPQPASTGVSFQLVNLGSVRNEGIEFLLNADNIVGDFSWSTSLNFAAYTNEVTDIGNLETEPFVGSNGFLPNIAIVRVGEPLYSYFGYEVEGVFQTGDDIVNSPQPTAQPGDLKFRDTDGNGELDQEDQVILGSPIPDFTFGVSNTFTYKRLSLSVFFDGSIGNEIFNRNQLQSDLPPNARLNRYADTYLNRWTPDNPTNENPSFVNQFAQTNNSRYVEDASFVRLRNINLGFQIPVDRISFIKSADVYISGQNLLTITDYTGVNPEANSNGGSGVVVDFNSYPVAKIYTLGANIRF